MSAAAHKRPAPVDDAPSAKQLKPAVNPYLAHLDEAPPTKKHHRPYAPALAQGELAKKAANMQKTVTHLEYKASMKQADLLKSLASSAAGAKTEGAPAATAAASSSSSAVAAVAATPSFERWDLPYLPKAMRARPAGERPEDAPYDKLALENSKATVYVEHPVPLIPTEASTESTAPLPMFNTKEETRKVRKNMREAKLRERRDMEAVGLLPRRENKEKITTIFRNLNADVTADPSAIEARIRKETAQREAQHRARNEANKTTPAEREARERKKLEDEAAKGVFMAVFRVQNVMSGEEEIATKRRNKMLATAQDLALTGRLLIVADRTVPALVVVEGGANAVRKFCRMMLRKLRWGARTLLEAKGVTQHDDGGGGDGGDEATADATSRAVCDLTWRGPVARREFDRFKLEAVDSVADAQRSLQAKNVAYLWDAAMRFDASMGGVAVDDL